MTNATSVIRQKEIHSILDKYSSIPWYILDRILQKLDDEDLLDLYTILYELTDGLSSYDEGYENGVSDEYQQGYDACIAESED